MMTDAEEQPSLDKPMTRVITSEELLRGGREVWIDHQGERYRLILTKNGRLILQK